MRQGSLSGCAGSRAQLRPQLCRYHHVLNRAVWLPLQVSQVLLRLLLPHLDHGGRPLGFGADETLDRLHHSHVLNRPCQGRRDVGPLGRRNRVQPAR